jgi:hypothetical protein
VHNFSNAIFTRLAAQKERGGEVRARGDRAAREDEMRKYYSLCSLILALVACGPIEEGEAELTGTESEIVGGQNASEGEYPFAVALQLSNGGLFCGASVVAPRLVLTAAHCVIGMAPGDIRAVIGRTDRTAPGGTILTPTEIIIHPEYDASVDRNDVALLRLPSNAPVPPLELASPYSPSSRAMWTTGRASTAIGWGTMTCPADVADILQEAAGTIQSDAAMNAVHGSAYNPAFHVGFDANAAGTWVERGDSGSPLLISTNAGWQVAGTVIVGLPGCVDAPEIYSRAAAQPLHRWLKSVIHETPAVGDVNGDGRDDIVTFTHGDSSTGPLDVWVALSNGTSFGASSKWQDWWAHRGHIPMLGDLDGDGKDDIFAFAGGDVWAALSTGSSFNGSIYLRTGVTTASDVPRVGDVNGDGRDDVVFFTANATADVFVLLSTGAGWGTKTKWHDYFAPEGETPMLADVNGDGREDIITFTQGMNGNRVYVALSTGTSFGPGTLWHNSFAFASEMPGVGRFNGDALADIVTFTRNALSDVYVGTSNGSNAFSSGLWNGNFGREGNALLTGDVNGDGRDDILRFTQDSSADVFVSLSSGTSFGAPTKWHDYFAP